MNLPAVVLTGITSSKNSDPSTGPACGMPCSSNPVGSSSVARSPPKVVACPDVDGAGLAGFLASDLELASARVLRSLHVRFKDFAAFRFSSKFFPNNHSSTGVAFRGPFRDEFKFAKMSDFRVNVSSLCKSTSSRPALDRFSISDIFSNGSLDRHFVKHLPNTAKHAVTFLVGPPFVNPC